MRLFTNNKGFTLIELIVVIAILGILAAVLVLSIGNYVKKSKLSVAESDASNVLLAAILSLDDYINGYEGGSLSERLSARGIAADVGNSAPESMGKHGSKKYYVRITGTDAAPTGIISVTVYDREGLGSKLLYTKVK